MKNRLRYALVLVTAYIVAWTIAYEGIFLSRGDGMDFTYYFDYLAAAWTFRGGELPSFMWLFSIAIFLPLAVTAVLLLRRWARRGLSNATPTI